MTYLIGIRRAMSPVGGPVRGTTLRASRGQKIDQVSSKLVPTGREIVLLSVMILENSKIQENLENSCLMKGHAHRNRNRESLHVRGE